MQVEATILPGYEFVADIDSDADDTAFQTDNDALLMNICLVGDDSVVDKFVMK